MMKYYIIFGILILIFLGGCTRERDITDPELNQVVPITGSIEGSLTLQNSPYTVDGIATVDSLKNLNIEPGVFIYFNSGAYLKIYGTITAVGSALEPIRFQPSSRDSTWKGIHIVDSPGQSAFKHIILESVRIEYTDSLFLGAISVTNSSATFNNCIFKENYASRGGAIGARNSNISIHNSIFVENESTVFGGAVYTEQCSTSLVNNTIYDNYCPNVGGGVAIFNAIYGNIQNNIFYENISPQADSSIYFNSFNPSQINFAYNFLWIDSLKPGFISTVKSSQDLRLNFSSICRDAGNPAAEFNDRDGTRNDQGAYGGPGGNW
jgi:predicted outer membrane repeat protein